VATLVPTRFQLVLKGVCGQVPVGLWKLLRDKQHDIQIEFSLPCAGGFKSALIWSKAKNRGRL